MAQDTTVFSELQEIINAEESSQYSRPNLLNYYIIMGPR